MDLADEQRIHDMKHYLCSELSHLSMRHKLRGLTLLEDALDYDDLPENSEAALLAALTPLITREKFLLRKRAIEALTALARRRPGGRLHCPAPALVAAWQALQDCAQRYHQWYNKAPPKHRDAMRPTQTRLYRNRPRNTP